MLKKHKEISIILLIFLALKLLTLSFYKQLWWDAAVYIGMGKYIHSFGISGFWEPSRPLVWPFLLGFFWKANLDPILFGRIFEIIISCGSILLTYLIGQRIFGKRTGVISAIFLASSSTFFFFSGMMLSEISSTFFVLLAIYYFLENDVFFSGIFFGISFMTRFLQLIPIISFLIVILAAKKIKINDLHKLLIGFLIPIMAFLIMNFILYNNPIFPFLEQINLSKNSGWPNFHAISFYFAELFKDNVLYPISFLAILLIFRKKDKTHFQVSLFLAFFLPFLFFNILKQKEQRLLLVIFPYLFILIAFSLEEIVNLLANRRKKVILVFIIVTVISLNAFFLNKSFANIQIHDYKNFEDEILKLKTEKVWISNPIIAAKSNLKIADLIYYPFFDKNKENELKNDVKNVEYIFIDSCDLACKPRDFSCEQDKLDLIGFFGKNFRTELKENVGACNQFIFKK